MSTATKTPGLAPSRGLFAVLLPAHVGQGLATAMIAPVLPLLAAYFGSGESSKFSAQLVVVAPFVGIIIGGLVSGWAIKSAGLRNFVLLAALLFAIGGVTGLIAPMLWLILAASIAIGFGAVFFLTGLSALTSMVYDGPAQGKVVGMQAGMTGLVNIALTFIAASLAERLGWRVPFGIFLAFGAIMFALTLSFVPRIDRNPSEAKVAIGPIVGRMWPIMLAGGMAFMTLVAQGTHLPFLLEENGIESSGTRGIVLTMVHAASVIGSLGFAFLASRLKLGVLILAIGIIGVTGWTMLGLWSGGMAFVMAAAALVGLCQGILIPMLFASAMRAAPGEASGAAVGLLNVAICLGAISNPLLTAPVMEVTDRSGLMLVLAGLSAMVTLVALAWLRVRRDGAALPAGHSPLADLAS